MNICWNEQNVWRWKFGAQGSASISKQTGFSLIHSKTKFFFIINKSIYYKKYIKYLFDKSAMGIDDTLTLEGY